MRSDAPLKAIACFDAVMCTGSTTLAAERLFVTPGAVGQQIRKLEQWLGVQLFVRSVRKLTPTESALRYWSQIKPALQQIQRANEMVMGERTNRVTLSLPPAFANSWFARRMHDFTRQFPNTKLHVNASPAPVDLVIGSYDLAVRHFDGVDNRLHSRLLLEDEARVYCSPGYRAHLRLSEVNDIRKATLLYTTSHANWAHWLAEAGVSSDDASGGLHFDQSELAIEAARRNQGIVLTSPWLVEDDIEQGRLVQLFEHAVFTGKAYYIVYGKEMALSSAAQWLADWLVDTAPKSDLDRL
ncbi:LysR substrate-binding domain-containing protein [Halomonas campaniensis]|uniref:LysR family transcriptional regulator n=1 Tax=Halomonas campaniensis TaxID=213554 RepID=A0A246RZX2_9GAMM|nr:LysR substrate-binding domain-containing protein [Halomonas campaniensis]OWV29734.1 LysR family transcriptional regulator [Halomonas campaniensis]